MYKLFFPLLFSSKYSFLILIKKRKQKQINTFNVWNCSLGLWLTYITRSGMPRTFKSKRECVLPLYSFFSRLFQELAHDWVWCISREAIYLDNYIHRWIIFSNTIKNFNSCLNGSLDRDFCYRTGDSTASCRQLTKWTSSFHP